MGFFRARAEEASDGGLEGEADGAGFPKATSFEGEGALSEPVTRARPALPSHEGSNWRVWLHTALFWGYLVLGLPVFFVPALVLFLVTAPFDGNGRILHLYTCFWCGHHVWLNPMWRLRVHGLEQVPKGRAVVFACNHQSAGDIPVLFTLFLPFKFVSKHQNFFVPFIGWNMALNRYVAIRRGDLVSAREMLRACGVWLRRGVSIAMFPEGTRSTDGHLLPFRGGAFKLAFDEKVSVVPVTIDGTLEALPKDGVLRQKGRLEIVVRVGAPIDPAAFAGPSELAAATRNSMLKLLDRTWSERARPTRDPVDGEARTTCEARGTV